MVRVTGLEPARIKQGILSPQCLPFHHTRMLVPVTGYAPVTSCVSGKRSTNELNGPGAPKRN